MAKKAFSQSQPEPLDPIAATSDFDQSSAADEPAEPKGIPLPPNEIAPQKEPARDPNEALTERIAGTQWRHLHTQDLGNGTRLAIAQAPGRLLLTLLRPAKGNRENPDGVIAQTLVERTFADRVQTVTRRYATDEVQRMEFIS